MSSSRHWPALSKLIGLRMEGLDIDADLSGMQRDCTIKGCQWLLVSWVSLQQLADCGQQGRKPVTGYRWSRIWRLIGNSV